MRGIRQVVCVVFVLLAASGCARRAWWEPIVDMKGVNRAAYQRDLAECKTYAEEVIVGQRAVAGAAAGAVVGGLIGAAIGNSDTAKKGAGAGAVSGAASGTGDGLRERSAVVKSCLRNRGYSVLN